MYYINSKVDRPSSSELYAEISKLMQKGVKIGNIKPIYDAFITEQDACTKDIRSNYGIANPNSSAQIINYMNSLNDNTIVETCCENGKWTSNRQAMQRLADMGYEFAGIILRYRKAKKCADSLKSIMDAADSNRMIHPEVSLTKTNRISYSNPSLMNIPKKLVWHCIVPSNPGNVLISADIKNQEPNIMINMKNIQKLKPALSSKMGLYEYIFSMLEVKARVNIIVTNDEKPGIMNNAEMKERDDIPAILYTPKLPPIPNAKIGDETIRAICITNIVTPIGVVPNLPSKVRVITDKGDIREVDVKFNIDFNSKSLKSKICKQGIISIDGVIQNLSIECTGDIRSEFKIAWNALTYGASNLGVNNMCRLLDGSAIYNLFTSIPELQNYKAECNKQGQAGIQITKTYFGTELNASTPSKSALKRVLMDLPIQGTAADILSLLVRHVNKVIKENRLENKIWIVFTRHDEIVFEATKELIEARGIEWITDFIKDMVEHKVDDWEPFKIEVKVLNSQNNTDINSIIREVLKDYTMDEQ